MTGSKNQPVAPRARRRSPPVRIKIRSIQGNVARFGSSGPADEVWRKQLKAALGTASDAFIDMALNHLDAAARMPGDGASNMAINGALAVVAAFAPKTRWKRPWRCKRPAALGGDGDDGAYRRRTRHAPTAFWLRLPPAAKLLRAYCPRVEAPPASEGWRRAKDIREPSRSTEAGRPSWARSIRLSVDNATNEPDLAISKAPRCRRRDSPKLKSDARSKVFLASGAEITSVEIWPDGRISVTVKEDNGKTRTQMDPEDDPEVSRRLL